MRLTNAGVPPRYWLASFESWRQRKGTNVAFETAQAWARGPLTDRGLFFLGEPGTGKTHLVVAALRSRMERGRTPGFRFVNVPILLDRLREAIRFTESSATEMFDFLRDEASVVVLDDLGKEKVTDWASERLYVLVESRYGKLLPTLVTSNRSLNELDALGYGALVSRLQETGPVVRLDAGDYRPELGR